jgi:HPt (histidine-containing phosphotransfer) domain-containing protein
MKEKEIKIYDLSIPMEASDDPEYLKEISGYFVNNSSDMLLKLKASIEEKDWTQAQHISHKLSSNFYMFGLDEGANALSQIEHYLMSNENLDLLPSLFSIAKVQGDKAIMQIKNDFDL